MAHDTTADHDDPEEGQGDNSAYDGLAVDHLNTEQGQAELADQARAAGAEVDEEVTI